MLQTCRDPNVPRARARAGGLRISACVAFATIAIATNASAQSTAPVDTPSSPGPLSIRPSRATPIQSMLLTLSFSGNTRDDRNDGRSPTEARPVADVDASLAYHRRGRHIDFDLEAQSVARRTDTAITPMRQQAAFDLTFSGLRQQFHVSQSASYSPFYSFGGTTDTSVAPELESAEAHGDFANVALNAFTVTSDVDWSRALSRRFGLGASYRFRQTTFNRTDLDMTSQEGGFTLTRRLTRYASLRTGYAYRVGQTRLMPGQQVRVHDVDAGIDFSRPIAQSKRTTVSFGTGSSLIPVDGRLAFNITGDAGIARRMARTWSARLGVTRNVRIVEGFSQPLLDNSVIATLSGNVRRRVSLSTTGSMSAGTVGVDTNLRNAYTNWTAASGVGVAMGRRMTLDVQYFCTGERFNSGVRLPPGLPNDRVRQGLRIGVTLRAPVMR